MEKPVIQFVNLFQLTMLFTGCDYTASFSRKGKVRPLKYLEKDETMQEVFGSMDFDEEVSEETFIQLSIMFVTYMENQS